MSDKGNLISFPGGEDTESPVKRVKKQSRRRRFTRLTTIGIIVLALAALLIGYFIYVKAKTYDSYSLVSTVERNNIDSARILEFDGSILSYSKDGANAVGSDGTLLWNQTFDMQNPMVAVCGNAVAFADYGGSRIYVQTSKGETGVVDTAMPIRKITTSENGYVAAVLEDVDVTWIYMYDINGTIISYIRTTMEKSGYPLDICLSPNGELLCVSYYYVDCNDVKSSVAFYNFGAVGENAIDNYVSGYNYADTMIPMVRFMDSKTSFALSKDVISVFEDAHVPGNSYKSFITGEVLSAFYSDDCIAIIYSNEVNGSKYRLELRDSGGNVISNKDFDFDYSNVTFCDGNVILYGDKSIYVGTYGGSLKYEGEYDKPMLLVVPVVGTFKYTIVTEGSIDVIELQ